jgi:hypothetical protein
MLTCIFESALLCACDSFQNADGRMDVVYTDGSALFWLENTGGSPPVWVTRTVSASISYGPFDIRDMGA